MTINWRIIDANINRVSEGIRVLEDCARFSFQAETICSELRIMRHKVRKALKVYESKCMTARDSDNDPGFDLSQSSDLDHKKNRSDLICGNFKRVQEGLRVIEENLKTGQLNDLSKAYEKLRYQSYQIEKKYTVLPECSKRKFPDTDIYCLTAEKLSLGRNNITVVQDMIHAGVKIIQYREKQKKTGEKYRECTAIRELTQKAGVTMIINDDIDLAMMVNADGVHIGQDDFPIETVRKLVGDEMFIGLSTHSPEQAEDAVRRGADYIGVGPIYKTETKEDVCAPVGLEYLKYVVKNIHIPFVAIGGIKADNIHKICETGAACAALVSEIVGNSNIPGKIKEIKGLMK